MQLLSTQDFALSRQSVSTVYLRFSFLHGHLAGAYPFRQTCIWLIQSRHYHAIAIIRWVRSYQFCHAAQRTTRSCEIGRRQVDVWQALDPALSKTRVFNSERVLWSQMHTSADFRSMPSVIITAISMMVCSSRSRPATNSDFKRLTKLRKLDTKIGVRKLMLASDSACDLSIPFSFRVVLSAF